MEMVWKKTAAASCLSEASLPKEMASQMAAVEEGTEECNRRGSLYFINFSLRLHFDSRVEEARILSLVKPMTKLEFQINLTQYKHNTHLLSPLFSLVSLYLSQTHLLHCLFTVSGHRSSDTASQASLHFPQASKTPPIYFSKLFFHNPFKD
ncbi:hypothetical protein CKAN_02172400 [Cinnamomum micranthum f. kanehirae]|uniref:Uncharacterized protein n=1 Tax=Cinnamomum micranthum f. kanehirae TaxID=337451 RepID=A0A443PP08_9MAGN|nr:hypothetical protein CKAN_02172400 [Cinnamomum micranthum f. kanehirae]